MVGGDVVDGVDCGLGRVDDDVAGESSVEVGGHAKNDPKFVAQQSHFRYVAQDCFRRVCLVFGGTQFRLDTLDLKGAKALLDALASC